MILGLDIGTSVTKAGLVSAEDGQVHALESEATTLTRLPGGRVEQDLEQVIQSVSRVVRRVVAAADRLGEPVEALALTAQGDGLWLRDEAGAAVRPAISWSDGRAADLVAEWTVGGQESILQRVFNRTGSGIFPGSQAALLAYLDQHEPESLARAAVAGYCADAVSFRLTGQLFVDASDASLPFMRVADGSYDAEALELLGVTRWRHLLAEPQAPGTLTSLHEEGARLTGLPVGTPVTSGPYDLQACAIGGGATEVGDGAIIFGTTLATSVYTDEAVITQGAEPAGMWLCTPQEHSFLRVMPSMVGATCLGWAERVLGVTQDLLPAVLAESEPGARGVRALSFLSPAGERAPFVAPGARGQFTGLSLEHTRGDLVRALIESVAFAARNCLETMGLTGEIVCSGGAMNAVGMPQIFADALGRPVLLPATAQLGIRGAALVALEALGTPVDLERWRADQIRVEPQPDAADWATPGYAHYLQDLAEARTRWDRT